MPNTEHFRPPYDPDYGIPDESDPQTIADTVNSETISSASHHPFHNQEVLKNNFLGHTSNQEKAPTNTEEEERSRCIKTIKSFLKKTIIPQQASGVDRERNHTDRQIKIKHLTWLQHALNDQSLLERADLQTLDELRNIARNYSQLQLPQKPSARKEFRTLIYRLYKANFP